MPKFISIIVFFFTSLIMFCGGGCTYNNYQSPNPSISNQTETVTNSSCPSHQHNPPRRANRLTKTDLSSINEYELVWNCVLVVDGMQNGKKIAHPHEVYMIIKPDGRFMGVGEKCPLEYRDRMKPTEIMRNAEDECGKILYSKGAPVLVPQIMWADVID